VQPAAAIIAKEGGVAGDCLMFAIAIAQEDCHKCNN
jgi:hypothetical protein